MPGMNGPWMMKIKEKFLLWTKHPSFYATCFWLVVAFIVLVISDFIIMPILAGHLSFTSEVPKVVGKSVKDAEAMIVDEDLKVSIDTVGRYSVQVPAGAVLVQVPAAGRRVKEGRTVHLILSKGMREVPVPDLRGKSQMQAEISLRRLGLVNGGFIQAAHASIPRGVVIRTEPSSGKIVRMGDVVKIVVSAGSVMGRQRVPDLIGKSLEQGAHILDSLGLNVGKANRKDNSDKASGTILDQTPAPGELLDPGASVELQIAD